MTTKYFLVEFNDLSFSVQQYMIDEVKKVLFENYKEEGELMLKENKITIETKGKSKWYVSPTTWQETYCRENLINWKMWNDLDENSNEFRRYDWISDLDEYIENEARKDCVNAFTYNKVEVEI